MGKYKYLKIELKYITESQNLCFLYVHIKTLTWPPAKYYFKQLSISGKVTAAYYTLFCSYL